MALKVGLYSKQLLFFFAIAIVGGIFYYLYANQIIFASVSEVVDLNQSRSSYEIPITIRADSKVQIADKIKNNLITPQDNFDLFKYIVFSQEGTYVDELDVILTLPKSVNSIDDVNPRVYAVHGVGDTEMKLINPTTIEFVVYNLGPNSTYTIELDLPKEYVNIPWDKELWYSLKKIPLSLWLVLGNIPLVITLIVLFYLYSKASKDWNLAKTKKILENPPNDLLPAEASAVVNNKITARGIAATLVDLARRGIIHIVDNGEYFSFINMNIKNPKLTDYEKILLDKIFAEGEIKAGEEEVEMRIAKHVFSRKIAEVYLEIYQKVANRGYFIEDPNKFSASYKRTGYFIFFFALFGFVVSMIYFMDLPYILIIWFSMAISAIFIIKIAPQMPRRTELGKTETSKWFAFKNFMMLDKPFGFSYESQALYEKYLPYAIAFNCEKEWTKRFIKEPFKQPNWLITPKATVLLEDVLNEVVPFVDFISYRLSEIKEPTV